MDLPITSGLTISRPVSGLILITALMAFCIACSTEASFKGTELTSNQTAEPFRLRDQFDQTVALEDLAGKVVILTFLYTNCQDICPLTTETLRRAYESLECDAESVAFVAISVDPARDTAEQLHRYSEERGMLDRWSFLTGSEDELMPVWRAYYIAAQSESVRRSDLPELVLEAEHHESNEENGLAGYLVSHSAPVYLIDQYGKLRVLLSDITLDAAPLVHDIRLLLGQ